MGISSLQAKVLTGRFEKNFAYLRDDLSKSEVARIKAGYSLFAKPWVQPPSSTLLRNGLGPHFNAVSCMSCHPALGRGAPPNELHPMDPALLFKVEGSESPYGTQIQPQSVLGVEVEAEIEVKYFEIKFENYSLLSPRYALKNEKHGALEDDQYLSPRIAPHLAGLGALEKISEADIKANLKNGGQLILIDGKIGRFGWKADKVSLRHQVAAAFQGDMGITSSWFPKQPCTDDQLDCLAAPTGVEPEHEYEISDQHLDYVVELMAAIEAPKRQWNHADKLQIARGETLFKSINCNSCHRESYEIENAGTISPYTDLLLHDMGDALADQGNLKKARLWRTAPLWGIGHQELVNGHTRLLHDGRARNIEEAILWHDGEALDSQIQFKKLKENDKKDLIQFLKSL